MKCRFLKIYIDTLYGIQHKTVPYLHRRRVYRSLNKFNCQLNIL